MGLLDFFRGGTVRPNAFELAILAQVEDLLGPGDTAKFCRRLAAINLVQRHDGGREVMFYQMERRKPVFPLETAIVDSPHSVDFAEVLTRSSEPKSRLRAVVSLMRGNLVSITFNANTEHAVVDDVDEFSAKLLGPPFRDPDETTESGDGWPVELR